MKENKEINLAEVLKETYVDVLKDERIEVARKIRGIVNDQRSATVGVEKAQKALRKAEEQLAKKNELLAKIQSGDWSVLKDENQKDE